MKFLILLTLSLSAIKAQTTVTGTFVTPTGDRVSGQCAIKAMSAISTPGGIRIIEGAQVIVKFIAGLFSSLLLPTDTAIPSGGYYLVNCYESPTSQTVNGRTITAATWPQKIWRVPTSSVALDIQAVEQPTIPPAPGLINLSQVNFAGIGNGCFSILNSVATVFPCGQLVSGLTWTKQTAYVWTQM